VCLQITSCSIASGVVITARSLFWAIHKISKEFIRAAPTHMVRKIIRGS